MAQPIDPVRKRIFSELNLQLAQHDISKDIMNETSKHLAFLARYYLNDPCVNPLMISVPIVDIPVISPEGGIAMAHKIALVVHETAPSSASPRNSSTASATDQGGTPTTVEKKDGEVKSVVSAKKTAETRHCAPPSLSAPVSASTSTSSRPRIRVLIQMIGSMGHRQCLVGGFCAIAERVVGGLLDGDEEMVDACEVSKKGKAGKKKLGKEPVWNIMPWGDYC
ncbi:hypothetical protein ACET3X_002479 [Alternaria dauci]|uniref:Uncharacterized protein n=1 Tax=Alternaria dauci TaxID=48095 RepID=A0ABR3UPN8_9PLEO